jgi:hypothetical protein
LELAGGRETPHKSSTSGGFAGVVVDEPNNHFTWYWKGALPANVATALAYLRAE